MQHLTWPDAFAIVGGMAVFFGYILLVWKDR